MLNTIKHILNIYTPRESRVFIGVVLLMFITALMEMMSIGAVLPFISIIQDPNSLDQYELVTKIRESLGLTEYNAMLIALLGAFVLFVVVKNVLIVALNYAQLRFSANIQARLALQLFSNYLHMDYLEHKKRNSSNLVHNVNSETYQILVNGFLPMNMIISEGLIVLCVVAFLFIINPSIAISIAAYGVILGVVIIYILRPFSQKMSKRIHHSSGEALRFSQESFFGIKEVIISGKQAFNVSRLKAFIEECCQSRSLAIALNSVPRAMFEITFILIFASTILILILKEDLANGLPILGVYAVAAFRLIPSLNRCSTAINQLNIIHAPLMTITEDLKIQKPAHAENAASSRLKIHNQVDLTNVHFSFAEKEIIKGINLSLKKGIIHAITGESGAGKTTLIDILTGLIPPSSGHISADGKKLTTAKELNSYMRSIAYVPQEIHITDDSVRANVAYGITPEEVDDTKVWEALKQANVDKVIKEMPQGLSTNLDEKGSRLSGGQRQRIGIARALYANPDLLIMDEPTAALDKGSEKELLKTLKLLKKDRIILLVTHSSEVVAESDVELKMKSGKIIKR